MIGASSASDASGDASSIFSSANAGFVFKKESPPMAAVLAVCKASLREATPNAATCLAEDPWTKTPAAFDDTRTTATIAANGTLTIG